MGFREFKMAGQEEQLAGNQGQEEAVGKVKAKVISRREKGRRNMIVKNVVLDTFFVIVRRGHLSAGSVWEKDILIVSARMRSQLHQK